MAEEGDFLLLLTKLFGVLRETFPNAVRSPLETFILTSPSLFYTPQRLPSADERNQNGYTYKK